MNAWVDNRSHRSALLNLQPRIRKDSSKDMGTYTDFSIAGYPLINSKGAVITEAMTVFRETDKRTFARRLDARNRAVWGDAFADRANEIETATQYVCSTDVAIDRLEVMGFTLNRARRDFDSGRQKEITKYKDWTNESEDTSWFAEKAKQIENLSFDEYLNALRHVMANGLMPGPFGDGKTLGLTGAVRHILEDEDDYMLGFFSTDIRCLIRVACAVTPKGSDVVQDITDLVDAGYYSPDAAVCQQSIDAMAFDHLQNANRIVLTEGVTDAQILKASLNLLYPHLTAYYSFLDFEATRAPGGAGQLASLVKGFAAAGIGNRVIAIFDNDSAARDARRSLNLLSLPPNIAVLSYPDIELLRHYPTLGPSGNTNLDVNGLAASIELYFGSDVLRRADGKLSPVQWKGYIETLGSYQGEVLGKAQLQAAFLDKLARAERDRRELAQQDWSGIDSILRAIFEVFKD